MSPVDGYLVSIAVGMGHVLQTLPSDRKVTKVTASIGTEFWDVRILTSGNRKGLKWFHLEVNPETSEVKEIDAR